MMFFINIDHKIIFLQIFTIKDDGFASIYDKRWLFFDNIYYKAPF